MLLAVGQALITRTPQKLEPLPATREPIRHQQRNYTLAEEPEYIDTESPTE